MADHKPGLAPPPQRKNWLKQAGRSLLGRLRRLVTRDHPESAGSPAPAATGAPGRFIEGRHGAPSPRRYMLYLPAQRKAGPAALLVMLHGCQQGAEEFAAGTRMNEAAEDAGVIVLYPEQSTAANLLRCWNWYALQDRSNSEGDAALIAAMTRQVILEHGIDADRVYVAGMSAGGGMAAVLARDYPDLYAALGVHSGVPAGLAHDMTSAMRLMSRGPASATDVSPAAPGDPRAAPALARIVFHGDKDATVHPSNGQAIHDGPAGSPGAPPALVSLQATTHPSAGRRGYTKSVEIGPGGVSLRELWIVHGAGHAWAGGSDAQQYTDANGPDASRELLRFFLQHRRAASK